jgi:hypothetical protein
MKNENICPIVKSIEVGPINYDEINTGSLEGDLELEAQKILKRKQQDNLGIILDSNYYFNVYFVSEQDKNEFLEKLGVPDINDVFINGYELAKKLGIELSKKDVHLPKPSYVKQFKLKNNGNRKIRQKTRGFE